MTSKSWPMQLFMLIAFLEGLCFYAPVASLYRLEYGVSLFEITLIEAIMLVATLALELPWGFVTARIGYKATLLWAGALEVLAAVLFWQASGFWMFLAQRLVLAAAISGFSGCDVAYLCRLAGEGQAHRALGRYNAVAYAGLVAVGLLFSLVQPFGYRALAFISLLCVLASALLRLLLPNLPAEPQDMLPIKEQVAALARLLGRSRPFLGFIACGAVLIEVEHTMTVFFASPAWAAAGIEQSWFGLLNLSLNLTGLLAGLASARLFRRLGPEKGVGLCWILAMGAALALAVTRHPAALLFGLPLLRFATENYRPCEQAFKNQRTGGAGRAVALSAYNMAGSLTAVLVGPLVGAGSDAGLSRGFATGAALLLAAGLLAGVCLRFMKKGNQDEPKPVAE